MNSNHSILMLGVGGMGMAPLALYLRDRGFVVYGYDDKPRALVSGMLQQAGVEMVDGASFPEGVGCVVHTSAIRAHHPLMREAAQRGVEILRRGEMLARQAAERPLIAIAGSHGKTTTTGMLIWALKRMGLPCGYVLGGLFADETRPASAGESTWLVAEVDESDGTIEGFRPEITLVPNLDWDHADTYGSASAIEEAFIRLFRRTKDTVFIPAGDETLNRLAAATVGPRYIRYGANGDFLGNLESERGGRQRIVLNGNFPSSIATVKAIGDFNASNAVAALAVAKHVAPDFDPDALRDFPGIRRRQSLIYNGPSIRVYQDYAHHPSEIGPLLGALRKAHPEHELVTVFQPHRYTRTAHLKSGFAKALSGSDRVYLLDVYAASEQPVDGGQSADLMKQFPESYPVVQISNPDDLDARLGGMEKPAVVAFVGAGDIEDWADDFARRQPKEAPVAVPAVQSGSGASEDFVALLRRAGLSGETVLNENEPLAKRTTLGVGGPARYYAEPAHQADLVLLLTVARAAGIEVFFLGRGSNLLVADEGFSGLVMRLAGHEWSKIEYLGEERIRAGAGVRLKQLCAAAAKNGMGGFEFLEGIPGTVGGALRMNAGAMGGWMFDIVESVELVNKDGRYQELPRDAFHASYRECRELLDAVAIRAVLKATEQVEGCAIRDKMDLFACKRKGSQPRDPSAGCIFKNPEGDHAGRLVDVNGLKGASIGAAEVSEAHGNFIVNRGGATAHDVIQLIRHIRKDVHEKTGINLQPEVLLLGKKWEDVL